MNHELILILDIYLIIFLNCKPQVSWMKQDYVGLCVNEHIAPDIKFAAIDQRRSNILLN